MNLLDLVEKWAQDKFWWTSMTGPSNDGYLHLCKQDPYTWERQGQYLIPIKHKNIVTLWADATWALNGSYRGDQRLEPADPGFFSELERLIVTKT